MQLRKLIRLLKEAEKKHGGFIECCVDKKFAEACPEDWQYFGINTIEKKTCVWRPGETDNDNERQILSIGNE